MKLPTGVQIKQKDTPKACWFIDKVVGGRRRTKSSGLYREQYTTHKDWYTANEEWYSFTLEQIRRQSDYGERPRRCFMDTAKSYLKEHRGELRDSKEIRRLLGVANGYIGSTDLRELSPDHPGVRLLISDLRERGVKNQTINNHITPIASVLRWATKRRDSGGLTWLKSAPTFPKLNTLDSRLPQVITWEEQKLLLNSLPDPFDQMCLFVLNTGLRSSEVCGIKVTDGRQMNGVSFLLIRRAKNQQVMPVVLNGVARSIFDCYKSSSQQSGLTHVFSSRGSPISQVGGPQWRKVIKELGWDLRVHDLRHTFGHRLREVGCPDPILRTLMGHKGTTITEHYSQTSLEAMKDQVEKISQPGANVTPILRVV